jgi:hypothetical protein
MLAMIFLFTQFFVDVSFAQTNETATTTTTNPGISFPQVPTSLKDVYNFFASINPFLLLIFGVVLFVMTHLGKYVAIVLIIFAIIQIVLFLLH